ncbi:uncharacterized protein VNE69_08006 [Vairimorpha necatrix]|uniref:Uncharacterized protein n=1 Tax=Vairimorpha necatrix TaxID=6039 RepID=A0AAX4JE00_9MICR
MLVFYVFVCKTYGTYLFDRQLLRKVAYNPRNVIKTTSKPLDTNKQYIKNNEVHDKCKEDFFFESNHNIYEN